MGPKPHKHSPPNIHPNKTPTLAVDTCCFLSKLGAKVKCVICESDYRVDVWGTNEWMNAKTAQQNSHCRWHISRFKCCRLQKKNKTKQLKRKTNTGIPLSNWHSELLVAWGFPTNASPGEKREKRGQWSWWTKKGYVYRATEHYAEILIKKFRSNHYFDINWISMELLHWNVKIQAEKALKLNLLWSFFIIKWHVFGFSQSSMKTHVFITFFLICII